MNLLNLAVLYLLLGVVCALAIWRREEQRAPWSALVAIPLWPLWAPVVLADDARAQPAPDAVAAARIAAALREGAQAADGTALAAMLNAASCQRIARTVERVTARRTELNALLARPELELRAARARVERASHVGNVRGLAAARLQLANAERLHAMAQRDAEALEELADLTEALRTQLLMVRFAGSTAEGIGDIVNDLWSRLEALSDAMESAA
jgi:hypothetical protein